MLCTANDWREPSSCLRIKKRNAYRGQQLLSPAAIGPCASAYGRYDSQPGQMPDNIGDCQAHCRSFSPTYSRGPLAELDVDSELRSTDTNKLLDSGSAQVACIPGVPRAQTAKLTSLDLTGQSHLRLQTTCPRNAALAQVLQTFPPHLWCLRSRLPMQTVRDLALLTLANGRNPCARTRRILPLSGLGSIREHLGELALLRVDQMLF